MSASDNLQKIIDLKLYLVELPLKSPRRGAFGTRTHRSNLIVEVVTDGGISGIGEVWSAYPIWGCGERINILKHAVRPLIIGEQLDDPVRIFAKLRKGVRLIANQWGAPGPVDQAIAGTDIAIWDAYSRSIGLPLRDAVKGKKAPDRVPVYGSSISGEAPAEVIGLARENGHKRFKLRLTFGEKIDREALKIARREIGDAPLMADSNQTWSPETMRNLSKDLEEANLGWIEEPFPVDDDEVYENWPYVENLPLAMGENSYGIKGIDRLMSEWGVDVIQPDITKTAGITEGFQIGRRVIDVGKRLCFHMAGGPIGQFASAHLTAAIDGADWVEMDANPNPLFERVCSHSPSVEEGELQLPLGAGLGVDLSEEAKTFILDD